MTSLADIPVAILCGGLGTRLGPLTEQLPKALVEVHGRPFLEYQLELLARAGFKRVVLCEGHLGHYITERISRSQFGLVIRYSGDGDEPLGTAGAVRRMAMCPDRPDIRPDPYWFVLYGDSYMPADYELINSVWLGTKDVLGLRTRTRTKVLGEHDYGVYVLSRQAMSILPTRGDLAEVLRYWFAANNIYDMTLERPYYEIGTPEALAATREWFASHVVSR